MLRKSNINVAIANILLGQKYLSDLRKPRYGVLAKISQCFPTSKNRSGALFLRGSPPELNKVYYWNTRCQFTMNGSSFEDAFIKCKIFGLTTLEAAILLVAHTITDPLMN